MAGSTNQTTLAQDDKIENLKASYLSVYQSLHFSKAQKPDVKQADIDRKCAFLKFITSRNSINAEAASSLLHDGLEKYANFVDSQSGLNNYWKQFSSLDVKTDNNPLEWEWNLSDPNQTLQYISALSCNDSPTLPCKSEQIYDRDVEKVMNWWKKSEVSPRARKISKQEQVPKQKKVVEEHIADEFMSDFENDAFQPTKKQTETVVGSRSSSTPVKQFSNTERPFPNRLFSNRDGQIPNNDRQFSNNNRPFSNSDGQFPNNERQFANNNRPFPNSDGQFSNNDRQSSSNDKQFSNNNRQFSNIKRQFSNTERQSPNSHKSWSNSGKQGTSKLNFAALGKQNVPDRNEEKRSNNQCEDFRTGRVEHKIQQANKNNKQASNRYQQYSSNQQQPVKKSLGGKGVTAPYVNPFLQNQPKEEEAAEPTDERLKNIEPKMIELIKNEIMDCGNPIAWDDIAGLERAKRIIQEIVVYPMLRPDIFTGLRRPPKGILLFGPPGTGKTLIGKCIASQSKSTFFSISASSLTSKWVGEGEKMVRALFAVAQVEQPSVVFIDEIDSLLCQRSETEHESSRRMKTEFLVQLDGAATGDEDRILVIGATNRPQELDEAARRRFVKRLYVPLPELEARAKIVRNLLKTERHDLTDEDVYQVAQLADGYSGADMTNLCKEASMGPIRSIPFDQLEDISKEDVRRVTFRDFKEALDTVRPSVSQKDLADCIQWDRTYGTASAQTRN